jgi:hypothetical protein
MTVLKEVYWYIACYYQAFGLGMVTILLIQHYKRKKAWRATTTSRATR